MAAAKTTQVTRDDGPAEMTALTEPTRRHLSARQRDLVDRVVEAAAIEARELGYEKMSVRSAARRAGVAPATAYTYFASKDHLLAEVLWRRLEALPPADFRAGQRVLDRVTAELGQLSTFMAADPEVAAACLVAFLGTGADVKVLRDRIGARIVARISAALGSNPDGAVLQTLSLAYIGAMLSAGMGHLTFAEIPDAMAAAAGLVVQRSS
jgi:AcrR family transcriptional regulator